MYEIHDLLPEIITALEAHTDNEGHTFAVDPVDEGSAWIDVTAPDGTARRFALILNEAE